MTTPSPEFDQYLVDYTVRNITTGDEEDIRVLELTPVEFEQFPEPVRKEIRDLVGLIAWQYRAGQPIGMDWMVAQDLVLKLLLPYISDRAGYDNDYGAWENRVLDFADVELAAADRERAQAMLDSHPPEDIADDES